MYGLALILVIVVMGGAIAYIGDKLGSRVGKRKLSIFGLRPKHTSILVTIITGILIAACTLGLLTLTSRDVRTALFGMEALKTELTNLNQEVNQKNQELDYSRKELTAKNAEYAALMVKIEATTRELGVLMDQLQKVTAERDQIMAERDQVAAELQRAQGEIQGLQQTKVSLDQKIAGMNEEIAQLNDHMDKLRKGIAAMREGVVVYRAGEVISTNVIGKGKNKEQVENLVQQIFADTNTRVAANFRLEPGKDVLRARQENYQQVVENLTHAHQDMILRFTAAGNTVYGEPILVNLEIFPNILIYHEGATVVQDTIGTVSGSRDAEAAILRFLQKVNDTAIRSGILPDPLQGTVGSMSGYELYEAISNLKKVTGKVDLTAVAVRDTYTSGPLHIRIQIHPQDKQKNTLSVQAAPVAPKD